VPILLQKSKIVRRQKSREIRFLGIPIAAKVLGADTKVRGRFCVKRYGPGTHQRLLKFLFIAPKILLQQYLPIADLGQAPLSVAPNRVVTLLSCKRTL
jgi:hypothetical protein